MSLKSMTGFGCGSASSVGMNVEVELGSVNRKQLDIRVSLPRNLSVLEPRIREVVQGKINRGNLNVSIKISTSGQSSGGDNDFRINNKKITLAAFQERAYQLIETIQEARSRHRKLCGAMKNVNIGTNGFNRRPTKILQEKCPPKKRFAQFSQSNWRFDIKDWNFLSKSGHQLMAILPHTLPGRHRQIDHAYPIRPTMILRLYP